MKDGKINEDTISVKKRNGIIEKFNINKIHKMVELSCENLTGVSISDIEMTANLSFYDGISTTEIHRALIKAAADLISEENTNYQYVAGRLLNYDVRKSAWGGNSPPKLYDHIVKMVNSKYYTNELLEFYTELEWNKINSFIDHNRDLSMEFIAVQEFISKYAIRDRSNKELFPLETPQFTYILIASIMMYEDYKSTKDLSVIKYYYNTISEKK